LNASSLPANAAQIAIIVSDGLNTQDRWYGDGSNQSTQVDAREPLVCTNMKAAGFIGYAIYVDLKGTQEILRPCKLVRAIRANISI